MKWKIHRLQITEKAFTLRLDQYLSQSIVDLSRTVAKKIIDLGGVHVNGRRVRSCSTSLCQGDTVEIYIDHLPLDPYRLTKGDILYQDQYIIVINKPALIETQPTHARFKGTLFEALRWYLKDPFRPHNKADIGMVQRLDRGTSGVMVFSIHPRAHKEMTRMFLHHEIKKSYLAVVEGSPTQWQGEIRSLLARSRKDNRVKSVKKGGKEAITRYEIVESFADYCLLNIEILTGRSHQIRAHMAEQNCPLAGDERYGGSALVLDIPVARHLLHAEKLAFRHPVLDKNLDFVAPLPSDIVQVLDKLRESC